MERAGWQVLAGALCLLFLLSTARADPASFTLQELRERQAQANHQRLVALGHTLKITLAAWNATRSNLVLPDLRDATLDPSTMQGVERGEGAPGVPNGALPAPGTGPGASLLAPAAAVPLVVVGVVLFGRRSVPSLRLGGTLFAVTTARGLPPPLLRPLLRLASMGLLAAAILVPVLFQPLLLASTGLLLGSVALASGGG